MGAAPRKPIVVDAGDSRVEISFAKSRDEARVSDWTRRVLADIASEADVKNLTITSAARSKEEQAAAMYDKLARGKKDRYKASGRAVQAVAEKGLQAHADRAQTIAQMISEIDKLGFITVSQHAGVYGLNVIDVARSTMTEQKRGKFIKAVRRRLGWPVYRFGHPGAKKRSKYEFLDHDCFHLAISQTEEVDKITRTA
jgi:hypothetical protein